MEIKITFLDNFKVPFLHVCFEIIPNTCKPVLQPNCIFVKTVHLKCTCCIWLSIPWVTAIYTGTMRKSVLCSCCVVVVLVFYGPLIHRGSFRVGSVKLSTLFLGKPPRQFYKYLVHILLPITDNSWISGRESMAEKIISWPVSTTECCRTWGLNPRPSAYQADAHPIELLSLAVLCSVQQSSHLTLWSNGRAVDLV